VKSSISLVSLYGDAGLFYFGSDAFADVCL